MKRDISPEVMLRMYENLIMGRRYEEKLCELFSQGKIPGWIHSGLGQEATGVAVGECLRKDDYLTPYHRSRSSLIAKGMSVQELTAEIFGRKTGVCNGVSGEAHLAHPGLGILGAGGLIGSAIPISVGLAYAAKLEGKNQIVACGFGEGGTSRGAFHEGVNMAAVMNLPIIFVCENNLYAEFSPIAVEMKIKDVYKRADAYGIPGVGVDGNDMLAVYNAMQEAVTRARSGQGPTLIEAKTYRWHGHYEGDGCKYRPAGELEFWQKKDPVPLYQEKLKKMKIINQQKIDQVEEKVRDTIEKALQFTLESPFATRQEIAEYVYA